MSGKIGYKGFILKVCSYAGKKATEDYVNSMAEFLQTSNVKQFQLQAGLIHAMEDPYDGFGLPDINYYREILPRKSETVTSVDDVLVLLPGKNQLMIGQGSSHDSFIDYCRSRPDMFDEQKINMIKDDFQTAYVVFEFTINQAIEGFKKSN